MKTMIFKVIKKLLLQRLSSVIQGIVIQTLLENLEGFSNLDSSY